MRSGRVDSGTRNRQATIQQGTAANVDGNVTLTWATYKIVWISLRRLKGDELTYARQIVSTTEYEAIMPYRTGIVTEMRLVVGTRTFNIDAIDDGDLWQDQLRLALTEVT